MPPLYSLPSNLLGQLYFFVLVRPNNTFETTDTVKSEETPLQAGFLPWLAEPSIMINSSPPSAPTLLHGTFSGHETFVFRYGWLKKGLDGLKERSDIFSRDEAVASLGVGKNMVRAIRHWCLATGLLGEEDGRRGGLTPTEFGKFLLDEADPYLERDGSLWLLHWHLATNPRRATTWYWAFNVQRESEWTRDTLQSRLTQWAEAQGWSRLSPASLKADVSCFVRSYVPGRRGPASTPEETLDCPLATLGLITEVEGDKRYRFNNRPKPTLPPVVFVYSLLDFWNHRRVEASTLSLRDITYGEGSPGRIFRLDEDGVLSYLDVLAGLTGGKLSFADTALIRQAVRHEQIDEMEFLRAHYSD